MAKNRIWKELLDRDTGEPREPWARPATPPSSHRVESEVRGKPRATCGKLLVVDDDPLVLAMTERALRHYGFEVLTAADGPTAVELYRDEGKTIDLVVLDMTMPGMDGIDTCVALYKLDVRVHVIFASGYDSGAADSGELPDCVKGFVQKPYRPSELVDLINGVIATDDDAP